MGRGRSCSDRLRSVYLLDSVIVHSNYRSVAKLRASPQTSLHRVTANRTATPQAGKGGGALTAYVNISFTQSQASV